MILIAFNVNLDSSDVTYAKTIGKAIRFKDGGFRYTKAMGFALKERNISQVSMNMVNYIGTPLYRTFEFVKNESMRYGIPVIGSEIVGLTPLKALSDAVEHAFRVPEITDEMIDWDDNNNSLVLNIEVAKFSSELGNQIINTLSENTGGFKGVKANVKNKTLVIKVDDAKSTPMHRIFYTTISETERFGTTITKMTFEKIPIHVLVNAAEFYLRIENFDIGQILEVKLREKDH